MSQNITMCLTVVTIVLKEFYKIHLHKSFFVVEFKKNLRFKCHSQIFKRFAYLSNKFTNAIIRQKPLKEFSSDSSKFFQRLLLSKNVRTHFHNTHNSSK